MDQSMLVRRRNSLKALSIVLYILNNLLLNKLMTGILSVSEFAMYSLHSLWILVCSILLCLMV